MNKDIVCWFSGGITSAASCILAMQDYGKERCRIIFIDTGNEHHDSYRFKDDFASIFDIDIENLSNDKFRSIEEVWYHYNSLNVATGAICSTKLKQDVRRKFEKENEYSHQVFGFEYDKKEMNRAKALSMNHPHTKPLFPLIDHQITKKDAIKLVESYGLKIPMAYNFGLGNNNCLNTGCIQGGIGYWQKIKREMPEKFKYMAKIEHDLTDRKGKPVTICKDQSGGTRKLVFLKPHPDYPGYKSIDDMKGREPKPLVECNGFCGTQDLNPDSANYEEVNYQDELGNPLSQEF